MIKVPVYGRAGVVAHAIVDDVDAHVAAMRWNRSPAGYAQRKVRVDGRYRTVLMHRLILGLDRGDAREVDHRNRDRLDNRRENLRVGTAALNQQNREGIPNTSSRFRGVIWERQRKKWRAQVMLNGRTVTLGRFDHEEDAAAAASSWRAEHMPFAREGVA